MGKSLRNALKVVAILLAMTGIFSAPVSASNSAQQCWWSSYEHDQPGVYGTKGVPSQSNVPGARRDAASWTDQEGNLWLMGGHSSATAGTWGTLNDLWKYNPRDNAWTWVGGSTDINQPGVYGTKGVPSQSNVPGSRAGTGCWTDREDNLWLMGGWARGFTAFGDLWKYNPRDNTWTWVTGSDQHHPLPDYGLNSDPGAREGAAHWTDQEGNVWLMGGEGNLYAPMRYNDLWKYNPRDNTWTCVLKDSEGSKGSYGVYGTKGIPSRSNRPASNDSAARWVDQAGNFWLMGGRMNSEDFISALWKYNPRDNTWTWVGGSSKPNEQGTYDSWWYPPYPGARAGAAHWTDQEGNFWLMGGENANRFNYYYLNDLWKYNPRTNKWTWVRK
jgi:hypothetical protein